LTIFPHKKNLFHPPENYVFEKKKEEIKNVMVEKFFNSLHAKHIKTNPKKYQESILNLIKQYGSHSTSKRLMSATIVVTWMRRLFPATLAAKP